MIAARQAGGRHILYIIVRSNSENSSNKRFGSNDPAEYFIISETDVYYKIISGDKVMYRQFIKL